MIGSALLDFLYPKQCSLCGALEEEAICSACLEEMQPFQEPFSLSTPGGVDEVHVVFHYEERAGQAVRRLKYQRALSLVEPMASLMRDKWDSLGGKEYDLIIPVPIHWTRKAQRGFNQAELLCSDLPEDLVRPDILARTRRTKPQVSLTGRERRQALLGAFSASQPLAGARVLLVDDVVTTGGTALACAIPLREAGAAHVELLAFCGEDEPSQ